MQSQAILNHSISANVAAVRSRIQAATVNSHRTSGIVQLITVSKTRSANEIRSAWACGLENFGESYLQEALQKQRALSDLPIIWHFIGPIQANKTAGIAAHFDWAHSVDRFKIAQRLNDQRPDDLPQLNICLQVNISGEPTKSGVSLDKLTQLTTQVGTLERLKLRGLMCIPAAGRNQQMLADDFARMKQALEQLNRGEFNLDTLSMGMSNDLECAIRAGATMVRIGTAIFGPRNYSSTTSA